MLKLSFLIAAILIVLCTASVNLLAQERPLSFHTRALISQYYATNRGDWNDPAHAFFFTPSIGGNAEVAARWRPDSSRLFFETGLCAWVWHYRAALNTRSTQTQYHQWTAGNGGLSLGIPLRAGLHIRQMASLAVGVVVLRNVSSTSVRHLGFESSIHGEDLAAETSISGINRTSFAFDLTAGFQLSPRLDVLLRGALDTRAYPTVEAHHYVTRGGLTRQYMFSGAPKLASVSIGLGFIL